MKKQEKSKKDKVLPPKPEGGFGKFSAPMPKHNIVAKSKKVRKKI